MQKINPTGRYYISQLGSADVLKTLRNTDAFFFSSKQNDSTKAATTTSQRYTQIHTASKATAFASPKVRTVLNTNVVQHTIYTPKPSPKNQWKSPRSLEYINKQPEALTLHDSSSVAHPGKHIL